jgi:glycosyltransferase involved in cell wall biosynthesis
VVTIRHELQRWFGVAELEQHRRSIRAQYGVSEDTLLIGMVGEFKSQKAYTRAVRVLAAIRREQPAKLMILGGWDHDWGHGRACYTATCRQAVELDVMPDLLTPGRVPDVERYYAAFDVFLNTSVYEGLSIATLEAVQAGCPIVAADAGGNAEGLPAQAVVVKDSADIEAYVEGIAAALGDGTRLLPQRPQDASLIPQLWALVGQYGLPEAYGPPGGDDQALFLTDNLNVGGAPGSLVHLLCALAGTARPWLGVMGRGNHQSHFDALTGAGVRVFSLATAETYLERASHCLQMIRCLGVRTVVFWNLDARLKLLLAKILPRPGVRLIDVSPGALLFDELDSHADFQRRIAFTRAQYFERLDRFVSKYACAVPGDTALAPEKVVVIPNGVPDPARPQPSDPPLPLPAGADPALVIGTCCRIVPDKRLELLVAMMAELNTELPGCHLVVVGGVHPSNEGYWETIVAYAQTRAVSNLVFVGHQQDVTPFLRQFRVFVMISDRQGCPNASLEAMALGLPVVANSDGGTAEQVEHQLNGFLVSGEDPRDMAERVRFLLTNPATARQFGEAGRGIARDRFSMAQMAQRYASLLVSVWEDAGGRRRRAGSALGSQPSEELHGGVGES